MSFVTQEDVFAAVEPVMRGVFEEFGGGKPVTQAFPMIPYREAMLKYGSDKPDLRNPIEIVDVTEEFLRDDVTFNAFKNAIAGGAVVRAIPAPGAAAQPRSFFDKLNEWAQGEGAPGLGYIIFDTDAGVLVGKGPDRQVPPARRDRRARGQGRHQGRRCPVLRLRQARPGGQARRLGPHPDRQRPRPRRQGPLRVLLDRRLPDVSSGTRTRRRSTSRTIPSPCRKAGSRRSRRRTRSRSSPIQYDIVCNGIELSSGAIRNHRPDIMLKAFEIAGYGEEVILDKFGGMYRALQFGAPPHGGIAPGIDRIVMLLADEQNLREVMLFPMNQRAEDLLMGAPSTVTPKQLKELHVRVLAQEK